MDNYQMQNNYQQGGYQQGGYQQGGYQQGGYQQPVIPEEYQPISVWGYFGYSVLFAIPIVGFICLLVFALGGTENINVRNFARYHFCCLLVACIVIGIGACTARNFAALFYKLNPSYW